MFPAVAKQGKFCAILYSFKFLHSKKRKHALSYVSDVHYFSSFLRVYFFMNPVGNLKLIKWQRIFSCEDLPYNQIAKFSPICTITSLHVPPGVLSYYNKERSLAGGTQFISSPEVSEWSNATYQPGALRMFTNDMEYK